MRAGRGTGCRASRQRVCRGLGRRARRPEGGGGPRARPWWRTDGRAGDGLARPPCRVQPVRELYGVQRALRAEHSLFVVVGCYTADAQQFGKQVGMTLVDGEELIHVIRAGLVREPLKLPVPVALTAPTALTPSLRGRGGRVHRRQGQGGPPPLPGTEEIGAMATKGRSRSSSHAPLSSEKLAQRDAERRHRPGARRLVGVQATASHDTAWSRSPSLTHRRERAVSARRASSSAVRRAARASLLLERVDDDLGLARTSTAHLLVDPRSDFVGRVEADQTVALSPSSLGGHWAGHGQPTLADRQLMEHTP